MAYKLALALGGGGVRCMAHAGVFIELERAGIVPDLIVGSSMGSVMGGVYAYKKDADFLWDFALNFAANPVVKVLERYLSRPPGRLSHIGTCVGFSFGLAYLYWHYGFLSSPFLKKAYKNILGSRMLRTRRFLVEDCAIDFAPVAVDLATARVVILTKGDIPDAMFASSALPGICKPHPLNGMELLDGGIVSLVPVMAAHLLGAERIVAVDTDAKVRGSYHNVVEMIEQASAIRGYRWNMLETGLADCIIAPSISAYVWHQFSKTGACIMAGRQAARAKIEEVRTLLASPPDPAKVSERESLQRFYPHIVV